MNVRDFIYAEIKNMTKIDAISDKSNLRNDLGLDSLDQLDLLARVESKYNLPTIEADFETVGDLIDVVEATDTERGFIEQKKLPLLYNFKNKQPYCTITEKLCPKVQPKLYTENPCMEAKCKIAKNVYALMNQSKTK